MQSDLPRFLRPWVAPLVVLAIMGAQSPRAKAESAFSAGAGVGLGLGSGLSRPGPTIGGEYTLQLSSLFDVGGSYDYTLLRYSDGAEGALHFYSLVGRLHLPGLSRLILDAKVGLSKRSVDDRSSGFAPGVGLGIGYSLPLGDHVELIPHFGVRYLPNASSSLELGPKSGIADLGLLFSFHF